MKQLMISFVFFCMPTTMVASKDDIAFYLETVKEVFEASKPLSPRIQKQRDIAWTVFEQDLRGSPFQRNRAFSRWEAYCGEIAKNEKEFPLLLKNNNEGNS